MKALVTGGAGFIGSHLCEALAEKYEVTALDNLSTGSHNLPFLKKAGVKVITGDIRDKDTVAKCVGDCDAVFHLAAMNRAQRSIDNPLEANDVNVNGTLNLLEESRNRGVKKFVFASSSSVYGNPTDDKPRKEDSFRKPIHPYGVGKLAGEEYCRVYHDLFSLNTIILRYCSVYGSRQKTDIQYPAVIPKFLDSIMKGEEITVYGNGKQLRQFTFIDDTVKATLSALKKEEAVGQVFNIANQKEHSIIEVVEAIEEITGKKAKVRKMKGPPEPFTNKLDTTKMERMLGYHCKYSLQAGLKEMVSS